MRLRILFVILMVCISVSLGGALAYLTSNYLKAEKCPPSPVAASYVMANLLMKACSITSLMV